MMMIILHAQIVPGPQHDILCDTPLQFSIQMILCTQTISHTNAYIKSCELQGNAKLIYYIVYT